MQIEQSVVMKLSHKEVGWDFTDQQEAAVYGVRPGDGEAVPFREAREGV